jgi:glycosyltransferase involved in cell wall biosynthesis
LLKNNFYQDKLISFCIPTKNRPELLRNTLDSILSEEKYLDIIEIVISDNSTDEKTKDLIDKYILNYQNIKYSHHDRIGFFNSLSALDIGQGKFLKLHNDYTKILPGGMSKMIDLVQQNEIDRNGLLFTNAELKTNNIIVCNDFDTYIKVSSFWNSWSSAFGIWHEDYIKFKDRYECSDDQFPHTSILLRDGLQKKSNIIVDIKLFENQDVLPKGGYNLFKNFAVNYPDILHAYLQKGSITKITYNKVLNDLLNDFFAPWIKTIIIKKDKNFTFIIAGWKKYLFMRYKYNLNLYKNILKLVLFFCTYNILKGLRLTK